MQRALDRHEILRAPRRPEEAKLKDIKFRLRHTVDRNVVLMLHQKGT